MQTSNSIIRIPKEDFNENSHLAKLLETPEPPSELFLEGELPPESETLLAVVGSRRCSSYGKQVVEHLLTGLAGQPVTIVSGLALGMDALAHKAALVSGLRCLAIPGSGLSREVLHPRTNHQLAEEILEASGGLLSEFAPKQSAAKWTFPKRNRIMTGLVTAVLVVEAGPKSGTLITSRLATEYNRDVLTVPGSIFSANSLGPNWLISMGATPVTTADELLDALHLENQATSMHQPEDSSLSQDEQQVLTLLELEPLPRDDLIRSMTMPTHEAISLLSSLELRGIVSENLGLIRKT